MRSCALACLVALVVAGSSGAADTPSTSFSVLHSVRLGTGEDAYGSCGFCLLERRGRPVALFGLNKRPGQKTRFAYLLLFRTAAGKPKRPARLTGGGRSSNYQADLAGKVSYEGREVEVGYRFTADERKNRITGEALKLGGKPVKPDDPRVYLVDLTRDTVTYVPVKAGGAVEAPDLADYDMKTWGASLDRAVEHLKKKSAKVKKFFEPER